MPIRQPSRIPSLSAVTFLASLFLTVQVREVRP